MRLAGYRSVETTQRNDAPTSALVLRLIASEDVARVDFILHVFQTVVEAVGNDGLALCLELRHVIDDTAAEECGAIGERRLIDYDLGTFGLYALHDALYGRLSEVVGV